MDAFVTNSIGIDVTQKLGNLRVEIVGRCEGEHNEVVLSLGEKQLDDSARKFGGKRVYETKVMEPHCFYMVFIFPNEENKNQFLDTLPYVQ